MKFFFFFIVPVVILKILIKRKQPIILYCFMVTIVTENDEQSTDVYEACEVYQKKSCL